MPRRLLSAAAACTLLLGLAACGEGEEGPVTTPPPKIDISGPSDGGGDSGPSDGGGDEDSPNAAPDVPAPDPADYAGMDENTPEGAEQAFRYYVAVSMWAHQTGDGSMLAKLEQESCERCAEFNADIAGLKQLGKYWSYFTIQDVDITPHQSPTYGYEIGYSFTIPEHDRPDLSSGELEEYEAVEYALIGGMDWTSDGWKVSDMTGEWGADVHQ
jgi:predicted small lipoprotein YifL